MQCDGSFCIPRAIWSHWNDDSQLPEDVEEMIAVSRKSLERFSYCLVSSKNISDFLDPNTFPKVFYTLKIQCQSDYIRVCLLEKYGGVYVDSTMYVTSGEAMEQVFSDALSARRSVFGFEKIGFFCIENSFIGAAKGSVFMKRFKDEYDSVQNGDRAQYAKESCAFLASRTTYGKNHECGNLYFLMHHIFLMLSERDGMKDDVLLLPAHRGEFALMDECRDDDKEMWRRCFIERLQNDPTARAMPFIKLPTYMRRGTKFNLTGDSGGAVEWRRKMESAEEDLLCTWKRKQ